MRALSDRNVRVVVQKINGGECGVDKALIRNPEPKGFEGNIKF